MSQNELDKIKGRAKEAGLEASVFLRMVGLTAELKINSRLKSLQDL